MFRYLGPPGVVGAHILQQGEIPRRSFLPRLLGGGRRVIFKIGRALGHIFGTTAVCHPVLIFMPLARDAACDSKLGERLWRQATEPQSLCGHYLRPRCDFYCLRLHSFRTLRRHFRRLCRCRHVFRPSDIRLAVRVGGKWAWRINYFLLSLTQEKFGSEERRLALLAPLPSIEATIHTETISLLFTRKIVL